MVGSLPTEQAVTSILVNPKEPQRMYAGGPGGVYRSSDAGRTWELASNGFDETTATSLAIDQTRPSRLFALLSDGSLMESPDGATTWRAVD